MSNLRVSKVKRREEVFHNLPMIVRFTMFPLWDGWIFQVHFFLVVSVPVCLPPALIFGHNSCIGTAINAVFLNLVHLGGMIPDVLYYM